MSKWFPLSGSTTSKEYSLVDVRAFNKALIRAHTAMQRKQTCVEVILNAEIFGRVAGPTHAIWCCKVADNTPPRISCRDRELTLRVVNPRLMGVSPSKHGGPWLSRALIYSLVAGLDDDPLPNSAYICKCAIGLPCPGKKANEAHELARLLDASGKGKGKEAKKYVYYEPSDCDRAND